MFDNLGVVVAWISTAELGVLLTTLLSVFAVCGLVVRFVLMPYLRDQLVKPIAETHRQVTQTHPGLHDPTLVDRLEDFAAAVEEVREMLTDTDAKVTTALRTFGRRTDSTEGRMLALRKALDQHISWAREEDSRLWTAVQQPILAPPTPHEDTTDDTHS